MTDTDTSSLPEDPDDRNSGGFAGWLNELAAAPNEDDLFAILASQRPPTSQLGRQQIRGRLVKVLGKRFKELDSGVSAPRTADAWLQEGGDEGDSLQGQVFVAEEIAPWGSAIRGADVLDEVFGVFDAYLYGSEENLVALTVWAAYSHVFDCFGVSPILDLTSPTKRCGKSSAVVVLRQICRSALLSGNITSAALFRAVEAWKPTLLIDEADTFAKMNDGLRGILNAGHTRDTAFVIRAEGDANEPRLFSTWAPKVVAAIGHLPDTIEDRAVRIELTRKPTYIVKRDAFDPEGVRADCADVRRKLARFALDELDLIAATKFERPAGLHDRAWNNWRPLLVIAVIAGGECALIVSGGRVVRYTRMQNAARRANRVRLASGRPLTRSGGLPFIVTHSHGLSDAIPSDMDLVWVRYLGLDIFGIFSIVTDELKLWTLDDDDGFAEVEFQVLP